MERKIGLFWIRAFWNASGPQGYQSTGLCACWRRYGDFSWINRWGRCSDGIPQENTLRLATKQNTFGVQRSAFGVRRSAFGLCSGVSKAGRFTYTVGLSSVNPHDALGDSGEDFPGDCPGLRRKFTGQDLLVALAPYDDHFLTWLNPVQVAHVDHDLVHGHPA